jgi:hypothetical protein
MNTNISPVLLIMCMFISVVKMQKWTGTYAWDNHCKVEHCCCYTGALTVTQSGSNLVFSSNTQGCGSPHTSTTFSDPNGYSFSAKGSRGSDIVYTLSSDANILTVRNTDYSYCGGSARRTSKGIHVYPSTMPLVIILAATWILL